MVLQIFNTICARACDLVGLLMDLREDSRRKGDCEMTDKVRVKLGNLGVFLQDTHKGSKWKLA